MPVSEIAELAADIKRNGQRAPVTLYEGKILDGQNRQAACEIAGIEMKTREFPAGADPVEFVISANLNRRHLTPSQRAMAAAKLSDIHGPGHPADPKFIHNNHNEPPHGGITITSAAQKMGASVRTAERASRVIQSGTKKQVQQVVNGEKTVAEVEREIKTKVPRGTSPEQQLIRDATGYAIPAAIRPLWARSEEAKVICQQISKVRVLMRNLQASDDPLYAEVNINAVYGHLNDAYRECAQAIPHAVCPYCQGQTPAKCMFCKGRGLVSKFRFEMTPVELIEVRKKSCTP